MGGRSGVAVPNIRQAKPNNRSARVLLCVQVLCADMVERFQISVYLLLVTGQNWAKDVSQNGHVSTQV